MPLAKEAAAAGLRVVGLDVDRQQGGRPQRRPFVHRRPDRRRPRAMLVSGFTATLTSPCWPDSRTIVICVPTPLDEDHRPDLSAVEGADRDRRPHLQRGHAGRAGVDHLARHHRRDRPPDPGGQRASSRASTSTSPSRPSASTRATPSTACATPQGRRRLHPAVPGPRGRLLLQVHRAGRAGQRHPRGRDGQAAGEHLPARQHRPRQRDGDLLRRARRRPLGVDRGRGHQAVRLPEVPAGPGRRRALHPRRPVTTSPTGCAGWATRSGSWSWPRRSTSGCPPTWSPACSGCSTGSARP